MKQLTLVLSLTFCLITAFGYIIARAILLQYAHFTGIDKVCAFVLLGVEVFILIHTIGYFLNIARSFKSKKIQKEIFSLTHIKLKEHPSVALLVAARHEPKKVLEETFISLRNLTYTNKEIFFLDDSSDEQYKKEAEELARRFHLTLFRRQERHGAKAGIINDCLKTLNHTYIAIFDADHCPLPEFLDRVIPILEQNPTIAFAQTPQVFTNISESRVAKAAAFQQTVFYEYICEGKSSKNAMFCCGTNVIFRKTALDAVGGLDETTVTEDFATSFKLHQLGWKSLYYEHAYAFGQAPETLSSYFKQQYRWANGTLTVLKRVIWQALRHPFSLSFAQWWEYFLSGSYYLIGTAFFLLMCFPILYLFFKVSTFFATPEVYLLAFLPYITLTLAIFYSLLRLRHYSAKDLFSGQVIVALAFPIQMKAAFFAFLGLPVKFGITEKTRGHAMSYWHLLPQLFFIVVNYSAFIWGMNRFFVERDIALVINSFWALYHCGMLSSLFYFNKERTV